MDKLNDICCWCGSELNPLDYKVKTIIGVKTQLEWYVCKKCQVLAKKGIDAIFDKIKDEDEQHYEEDKEGKT
jgi:hypothetical protein